MSRGQDVPGPGSAGILRAGHADTPVAGQPPRARPEPVLPSPAVGRALLLAVSARCTAPIGRPPPLPRPHWRTALCPRRVTFSRHSPRPVRPPRAGRGAGSEAAAAVIGGQRCRSGRLPAQLLKGAARPPGAGAVWSACGATPGATTGATSGTTPGAITSDR